MASAKWQSRRSQPLPPNKKTIRSLCTKEYSSGIAQKLSSYKKLQQFSGGGGGKQKQNEVMERIRTLSLSIPYAGTAWYQVSCKSPCGGKGEQGEQIASPDFGSLIKKTCFGFTTCRLPERLA